MGPEGSGALAGALGGGVLGSGALGGRVQGNGTTEAGEARLHWESLLLLLIPTLTIFGNGLVVLSILREKSLKTVTNYFIFSLAVADFLVALLVMPFAVYVEVSGTRWLLGHVWCNIYIAFDVCASTASIFNLLAISVDRYIAITRPIHYSRMGKSGSRAFGTICFVWALSFLIAVPIVAGINEYDEAHAEQCVYTNAVYIAISSFMSFYIPAAVMGVLYVIILVKLRQRAKAMGLVDLWIPYAKWKRKVKPRVQRTGSMTNFAWDTE